MAPGIKTLNRIPEPSYSVIMWWYSVPLLLAVLVPQGYLQSTDKKVVYLVEELHDNPRDKANAIADEGAQPKRGVALTNPIPENQAGDGVYFRPENGAPVPEGQVSSLICTYRVDSFIFFC